MRFCQDGRSDIAVGDRIHVVTADLQPRRRPLWRLFGFQAPGPILPSNWRVGFALWRAGDHRQVTRRSYRGALDWLAAGHRASYPEELPVPGPMPGAMALFGRRDLIGWSPSDESGCPGDARFRLWRTCCRSPALHRTGRRLFFFPGAGVGLIPPIALDLPTRNGGRDAVFGAVSMHRWRASRPDLERSLLMTGIVSLIILLDRSSRFHPPGSLQGDYQFC